MLHILMSPHLLYEFLYANEMIGEGNGTPLQYSCLENPMDGGPWWAAVHGVAGSRARLSDFTFTFHFHALEKEMATHSSVLAWRIPGKVEPDGLPSLGSHRVGHDWSDLAAAAAMRWFLMALKPWTDFTDTQVRRIFYYMTYNIFIRETKIFLVNSIINLNGKSLF